MPQPEIARRCHACGASIRDRAFFCPQCGISFVSGTVNELAETQALSSFVPSEETPPPAESKEHSETQLASRFNESAETQPLSKFIEQGQTQPLGSEHLPPGAPSAKTETNLNDTIPLPAQPTIAQRPGGHPPNYGAPPSPKKGQLKDGSVGQRVEKLRKISTVVIDQATYDPSLRFILVAGFLLQIFLIIVIMNRFIS